MTAAGRATRHAGDAERVELQPPDISAHRAGNTGIPYVTTLDSGRDGPHAAIVALMHGNEYSGAIALDHLLSRGIRPTRGKLSLVFANVAAFAGFVPDNPGAARFIDEDMNRLWAVDDGSGPVSAERARVRELRPLLGSVDLLLDLHSMQSESPPLLLAGPHAKGRAFARTLASPATIVCDAGHANGTRLRDSGAFGDPVRPQNAILAECGQHWKPGTAAMAIDTAYRFLSAIDMLAHDDAAAFLLAGDAPDHWVEVTGSFVPNHDGAQFRQAYSGMETIPERGTAIAQDGHHAVRTPYEDCVLVMPARQPVAGLTAVRFGRRRGFDGPDDG